MRSLTALVSASAVAVGLGGGAAAYQLASAPVAPTTAQTGHSARPAPRPAPGALFRWAPCRPPAVRQGDACVTEVVRTVVRPASGGVSGDEEAGSVEDHSGVPGDDLTDDATEGQADDEAEDQADEYADEHDEDEADEQAEDEVDEQAEDHAEDDDDGVELGR